MAARATVPVADANFERRVGRDLQRWDGDVRLVAGVVPVREDGLVMLISSTKAPGKFGLPKGGWESDEEVHEAAQREALEEAGIRGELGQDLGEFEHISAREGRSRWRVYILRVKEVMDEWAESYRERRWYTFEEALRCCRKGATRNAIAAAASVLGALPAS